MLPIVKLPGFVENILPRFSLIFNKSQLRHFGEYLTGLDERLCMVKEQCEKCHITDGIVVIDDSLAHKSGKHIEGANWFWDHTEHGYRFAHQLVTSQYVTKKFHVPLHYRLYLKEGDVPQGAFQSKIELAIQLIKEAAAAGIPFSCVAADRWYFCVTIIKYLAYLGKKWVFASKSNRIIFVDNRWMSLKEF